MTGLDILKCPLCGSKLNRCEKQLVCVKGHSYDISSEGYANLLPPGRAGNSKSGDDREMLRSRHQFLTQGYYDGISNKLADILIRDVAGDTITLCDMGCGEGYHMVNVSRRLQSTGKRVISFGFDASKHGASIGNRFIRQKELMPINGIGTEVDSRSESYVIPANIFRLPVYDGVFSVAVSMFAPVSYEESHRILSDDGILITVSSGKEHLIELRRLIFDKVEMKEYEPDGGGIFTYYNHDHLSYMIHLEKEDLIKLFKMTPFFYRTGQAGIDKLQNTEFLDVTVSVNYRMFRKAL